LGRRVYRLTAARASLTTRRETCNRKIFAKNALDFIRCSHGALSPCFGIVDKRVFSATPRQSEAATRKRSGLQCLVNLRYRCLSSPPQEDLTKVDRPLRGRSQNGAKARKILASSKGLLDSPDAPANGQVILSEAKDLTMAVVNHADGNLCNLFSA
jgi:hypothetical protein